VSSRSRGSKGPGLTGSVFPLITGLDTSSRLNPDNKREKTYRIKTNNQEELIRKQNESDATSKWIEFQKTSLWDKTFSRHMLVTQEYIIFNPGFTSSPRDLSSRH